MAELPNEVQTPFQWTSELLDIDISSQQCGMFMSPKNFSLMDTPAFSSGLNYQYLAAGL